MGIYKFLGILMVLISITVLFVALGHEYIEPSIIGVTPVVVCPSVCPTLYEPVCGVDGITYSNDCVAGVAGVEIDYSGICRTDNWWLQLYDDINLCYYQTQILELFNLIYDSDGLLGVISYNAVIVAVILFISGFYVFNRDKKEE